MERAKRIGGLVLPVAAGAVMVAWLGLAISLSIQIWSDQCPFAATRCDFEAVDDGFAAFLVAVPLGGVWLGVRRRWAWAAAVLAFWVLVPFLLLWTSQQ